MDCVSNCLSKSHFLFKHLNDDELNLVLSEKKEGVHKRGSVLYYEGNRINGIYCINTGIIKVFKTGNDGKEQILRFARMGEIIGYRSVLSSELACTTAEVINEATSCYIPGEIIIELIKNNGDFAFELMQLTCRELGEANSYITDIAQKTAKERLAEILIHLKDEFGVDENNVLKISLTREELANIVGTATESIIRMLSEFKHDNLLEIKGREIKILNYSGLENISNSFY
ncbi:MAG: Crp/Fnr family transcriptional regulator [Bacteroidales bacterium]|nr:Crp/Fnr family transcriptional regulator [Bacteroidales bacterium]MCF8389680.1 Crp/Fnr family transcriptional regulator [Bacteroidales bacterium]